MVAILTVPVQQAQKTADLLIKAGIKGILVRTGKFLETDLQAGIEPYAIISSIEELPRWWNKHVDQADETANL